jgi:hypothetical protein
MAVHPSAISIPFPLHFAKPFPRRECDPLQFRNRFFFPLSFDLKEVSVRHVSAHLSRLSKSRHRSAIALAIAGVLGLSAFADPPSGDASVPAPAPLSNQELAQKVLALEAEVHQLRTAQAAQPKYLDPRDVDTAVAAVLQDAGRHTLNFPPGGSSGHDLDKGFFIASDDGRFSLYPDLLLQFRGVVNNRVDALAGHASTQDGFEIRRAKFGFYGTAFDPDFSFRFLWQDAVAGGTPALQFAWGQYIFAHNVGKGDLGVRAGQFKDIVFKEETTPDRAQLFAERSLVNSLIGGAALGSEIEGVDLLYTGNDSPLHADLLLHDGIKRSNTTFSNEQPVTTVSSTGVSMTKNVSTNFGVAGRVDYKLFGRWGDGDDLTGVWGREDLLVVGGGADFTQMDHSNLVHWTADVQYQLLHRLSLLAAVYGNHDIFRNQAGPAERNDYGAQVEAGYFVTRSIQPIARYSITKFSGAFKVGGADTFHEIAGGVNWFFGKDGQLGNRAKLTLDVTYLPDGTPAFAGGDFLASPNKKDELVFRAQVQLSL